MNVNTTGQFKINQSNLLQLGCFHCVSLQLLIEKECTLSHAVLESALSMLVCFSGLGLH